MEEFDEESKRLLNNEIESLLSSCMEFDMSKDGVIKLMDFMGNVLSDKILKKHGKSYDKNFKDCNDRFAEAIKDKTFGSGENDEIVLKMMKNMFKQKLNHD